MISPLIIVALGISLSASFYQTLARQQFEGEVRDRLQRALVSYPGVPLGAVSFEGDDEINPAARVICEVTTPYSLGPDKVKTLQATLPRANDGREIDLHVRSILTSETTVEDYVHQSPAEKAKAEAAKENNNLSDAS